MLACPLLRALESGSIGEYTLTPAQGDVSEIASIKIEFPGTGFWGIDKPETDGITLTGDNGLSYVVVKTDYAAGSDATLHFAPAAGQEPVTITDPGSYTLTIPAGAFKQYFSTPAKTNDEIKATYTIKGAAPNHLTNYTLTPAAGEVSEIASVKIDFPDTGIMGIDMPETGGITLIGDNGLSYVVVKTDYAAGSDATLHFGTAAGEAPVTVTAVGTYTLTIPAGSFKETFAANQENALIKAQYVIAAPQGNPLESYALSPADGEVESLSAVNVTFENAASGLNYPARNELISLTYTAPDNSETVYPVYSLTMPSPYRTAQIRFGTSDTGALEFTAPGTYTVTMKEGAFSDNGNENNLSPEITATYTIKRDLSAALETYTTDPAAGQAIGELKQFSITFPESGEGLDWPIDVSGVTLVREEDETVYHASNVMLSRQRTAIIYFSMEEGGGGFDTFRAAGRYTVFIPAGAFVLLEDKNVKNGAISVSFTIDEALNFNYTLSPAAGTVGTSLPDITLTAAGAIESVSLSEEAGDATFTCGEQTITLQAKAVSDKQIVYSIPADSQAGKGEWTLRIPARSLDGVNTAGTTVTNTDDITAVYTVKAAQQYAFTTAPAQDETVAILANFTVTFNPKPKKTAVREEAGTPVITDTKGNTYTLKHAIANPAVIFAPDNTALTEEGTYSVSIPAGYIVTTDSDGLEAEAPEIKATFKLVPAQGGNYDTGYMVLNEGWYGHDNASLNHIGADGTVNTRLFATANPAKALGVTGQYLTQYGDKWYAVCKQSGDNIAGIHGSVLTALDKSTLMYSGALPDLAPGLQAHAFVGAGANKGYLSTTNGIFPVDLDLMTAGEKLHITESVKLNAGEMILYRSKVYAVAKNWNLIEIDPADDQIRQLDLEAPLAAPFVSADGSLWFATTDASQPFVKYDPETLVVTPLAVEAPEGVATRMASPWTTWRGATLAADLKDNVIYYTTREGARQIARLDLDNGEFKADFINLPENDGHPLAIYGAGVNVDPVTGEIVLTVTETGDYRANRILRADPATGEILNDKTVVLADYYWFPAMSAWCGYKAPVIDAADITVGEDGTYTLDLGSITALPYGNKALVDYTVASSDFNALIVEPLEYDVYKLTLRSEQPVELTLTAGYYGMTDTKTIKVQKEGSGVTAVETAGTTGDVYNAAGIIVLRDATAGQVRGLAPGLYIYKGKKIIVK